jgi:hypothetical protein
MKKILIALIGLMAPALALAQMTSDNYRVEFDDISGGGVRSTSDNYAAEDTLGEIGTGEDLSSDSYRACVGFQCLLADSELTVTFAVSASPCDETTTSAAPRSAPLGALTLGTVTTAANHVCIRTTATNVSGVTATVRGGGTGLTSTSQPADVIDAVNATLVAGTEGYGVCSQNAQNGFTASAPFNGSCDGSNHAVGPPTTTPQTIYTASGAITDAYGDVRVKAAISSTTPAHNDYSDTLTFIVTATY